LKKVRYIAYRYLTLDSENSNCARLRSRVSNRRVVVWSGEITVTLIATSIATTGVTVSRNLAFCHRFSSMLDVGMIQSTG